MKSLKPFVAAIILLVAFISCKSDKKVQQKADELNKIVVKADKGFVIKVISKGKQIIFETKDKNLFLLKPIRIQTNCYKYRCPVTFFVQEFDEVIRA